MWVLSRFDDVQAVARNWETFSHAHGVDFDGMDRLMLGRGDFLETDPPRHSELRKIVQRRFSPKALKNLEGVVRDTVRALLRPMRAGGEVELLREFVKPLPLIVFSDLMGVPQEDVAQFEAWNEAIFQRRADEPDIPQLALDAANEMRTYFASYADAQRYDVQETLLGDIVAAHAAGVLDEEELVGITALLFVAGAATTWGLISNALLLLEEHAEQRHRLANDLDSIPAATEEVLRFESPLQHSFRTTTRDVEIHGAEIRAGSRVLLLFGSANRDERRWEAPEKFDIYRQPLRNLAFGEGIHHCLGAPLARMEARVAIEEFLVAFPNYEVLAAQGSIGLATHSTKGAIRARL